MNFDAFDYFSSICNTLKKSKDNGYYPCKVSGLANMEEVINAYQTQRAYFAIDDTNDGHTFKSSGGGYFDRKQYIVFILRKFAQNNMDQQKEFLQECRQIYKSVCKKLIKDKSKLVDNLIYLNTDRIPFYEIEGYGIAGCTGLYFIITVDEPTNLCYDASEWYE
ncbi:hypothetical protein [Dysgonomonas gadei]|uniref:hypothetical protein n=1 Tax=Dysgonomonas gadei TaxID=156974 RepID=UPI003AF059A0